MPLQSSHKYEARYTYMTTIGLCCKIVAASGIFRFTANKSARSFVKMPPYWDKIILVVRDCVYSSWQSSSDSHFEMVDVPFLLFSALAVFLNIAPLCWQIEHNNSGPVMPFLPRHYCNNC